MIGYVGTGASFYECIRYCLEDKRQLSEQQKIELAARDHLQHKERAEVLIYNQCGGNKHELTEQFLEVMKLNRRVEKPVLHISLRLAPGDVLTKAQMMEMGQECAKEFGIADHQYICVLHKDTNEPHIHIAANRVGFDGRVASDSNNYKRMAALCRRLEKRFRLTQVLSPRKFLSPAERILPRHDSRKEKLRADIRQTLENVSAYSSFEQQMKALGYKVIKGRGICFIDDKKVKIKGSEVGFSLATIERVLSLKEQITAKQNAVNVNPPVSRTQRSAPSTDLQTVQLQRELSTLLQQLFRPEQEGNYIDPELMRDFKKKKKRLGQSPS
ncbi:relaxase/mobilization nuclease-like protein [Mucilaginibacter gracilis]|uniref:Relaxase/mobilization nuclease-like protein n=1 Tax=Mucilaginibacter gracilis TaxID=423350 RepID=A0A495J8N7_9SPHI|nr:relaxase/mobilization nuclease domain-containing protein [Mucilaginibacter gracilis]RKR84409.1 relaxase/mobilization nuclease-like protein [Mucilaginibacter gracilis]